MYSFLGSQISILSVPNSFELLHNEINSLLQKIGKYSFGHTSIKEVTIQPHVTQIHDETLSSCKNLINIVFYSNSELKYAFADSLIKSVAIPSEVSELKDSRCLLTQILNNIKIGLKNTHFYNLNDKFIFGKTDKKGEEYVIHIVCESYWIIHIL